MAPNLVSFFIVFSLQALFDGQLTLVPAGRTANGRILVYQDS